jgi:hypothetical protein
MTYRYVNTATINDLGQILGTVNENVPSRYGASVSHSFLYADGVYTTLEVPGALNTTVTQLNDVGQIVGTYRDTTGTYSFIYQNGHYATIAVPGAAFTSVIQTSSSGKLLGTYFDGTSGLHPFIYDQGHVTNLGVPGATSTYITSGYSSSGGGPSINDAGQVIGTYNDASGSHPFLYDGHTYTTLAVPGATGTTATKINNAGQVLGTYYDSTGSYSFVYANGSYTAITVPGATNTYAASINDAGQVAGTYNDSTGSHVFLDTNNTYVTLDPTFIAPPPNAGSYYSSASFTALNNAGDVLGSYYSSTGSGTFLYSDGTSRDVSVPNAPSSSANGMNDVGQLIGSFYDGINSHAFLATPVTSDIVPPHCGAALNATVLEGSGGVVAATVGVTIDQTAQSLPSLLANVQTVCPV